ncbi:MAG: hypothetical protein KF739_04670 [Cryobacterium sp.]|nr:hypothetical protein [Cryobacterium sp.]
MTVIERPLFGKVDIQVFESGSWVTYLSDATGVSIRRGGVRDGLGVKTDVGILSFTLKDRQDPLGGGTFVPGMKVRVLAGEYVAEEDVTKLSQGFESSMGSWGAVNGTVARSSALAVAHTGTWAAAVTSSGTLRSGIRMTVSGLTVGRSYTFSAWFMRPNANSSAAKVGIVGGTQGATITPATSTYGQATVTFTATSASHGLDLSSLPTAAGVVSYWDDLQLIEHITEVAYPIFTGQIVDVASAYPFDKSRGTSRSMVTVTASDAVLVHTSTPRYGVQIAEGFETFESRINRLSSSAQAPIEVPPVGAPREVYAF